MKPDKLNRPEKPSGFGLDPCWLGVSFRYARHLPISSVKGPCKKVVVLGGRGANIKFAWQSNNALEWKADKSLEASSWIREFWYEWSLTRDLHFKLYYTPNWETHYHKVNVLFSYNFAPKSWLYLAFNEGIDNSAGKPKTKERVIILKLSRLFSW